MEVTVMANTSELLKSINDRLNKIIDDFDPDDASAALTHILNICEPIAYGVSYESVYKISDDLIECAIKLDPTGEIAFDDDDYWRHIRTKKVGKEPAPIKLESKEATTKESLSSFINSGLIDLDVMIGNIADRINSIDSEVEAIKEHLTEHGLGIDSTFNCDEILKRLNEKNEAAKKTEFKDIYPWPVFECGVEEDETPSLEQINDMCAEIESICKRLDNVERANIEMCAALLRSNKKFRKAFKKTITKVKAVKHIDTDKLVPDKEIPISEE
jgi:hypothetical protein